LLDVKVRQGPPVLLQLVFVEDERILAGQKSLPILDLGLNILDRVRWLHLQGEGLVGPGPDRDLHVSTVTENNMKGGFLLDVVIGVGAAVLGCLPAKIRPC